MSEKTEGPPSKTSLFKFSNIKSAWSTYIAIDYFDEDNALVDHLGTVHCPFGSTLLTLYSKRANLAQLASTVECYRMDGDRRCTNGQNLHRCESSPLPYAQL